MKSICRIVTTLSILLMTSAALAQSNYPDKTIRILVGFGPGTAADLSARILGDKLAEALGKTVIIENVPGAAGNLATERAAKSAPDGYTLLMGGSASILINPTIYKNAPVVPLRDLAPISQVCVTPNVLVVNADVPAKTLPELVALAKAQPGKLTFGSAGIGSIQQLAGELLKSMAHIDIQHVPYRGSTGVVLDLVAGRISMFFGNTSTVLPLMRQGKLRALAVTSVDRSPAVPDVPTMAESGYPGFNATIWFGLTAPAGTPAPILDRLYRETVRILAMPEVRAKFANVGMAVVGNSPAQFTALIKSETTKWVILGERTPIVDQRDIYARVKDTKIALSLAAIDHAGYAFRFERIKFDVPVSQVGPMMSPKTAHIFSDSPSKRGEFARWMVEKHPLSKIVNKPV